MMENILLSAAILGISAVISQIVTKGIERLYVIHRDLLVNEAWVGERSSKRFYAVYVMILLIWMLLTGREFLPLVFAVNLLYSLLLIVIIMTDYEQHLIFDRILVAIAALAILSSGIGDLSVIDRVLGALGGGIVMFILAVLMRGTLGGGDIKLVFVLGLWQGIDQLPVILLSGFIGGGIAAGLLLLFKIKKRKDFFAYGPYFVFGALFNMIVGNF